MTPLGPTTPQPMLWALLLLSLGGLALGPLLVALGRVNRVASAAIDGFTIGAVPLLVIVRLMPHAYDEIGGAAVLWALVGFGLVTLAHRGGHALETRIGQAVVLPTLTMHAVADGTALALSASSHDRAAGMVLAVAIVMHRLPEGLFIASTSVPVIGWKRTMLRLCLLAGATIAGATIGSRLLEVVPDSIFEGIVAFGLGAMLRMVVHQHDAHESSDRASRAASGGAFVIGVTLALGVRAPHSVLSRAQAFELSIAQSLIPLFVEVAPVLLLGVISAAILQSLSSRARTRGGALRGLLQAILRPFDATRPSTPARAFLLSADAPFAVAFAIALPALSIDAALLSLRLVGLPITLARLAVGAAVALVAAIVVARVAARGESFAAFGQEEPEKGGALDRGGLALVAGLVLAAVVEAALKPMLHVPAAPAVIVAALVGALLGVPSLTAVPIAAVLVHKGLPPGAALALLIAGPASDHALHTAIKEACGARASALARATVLIAAIAAGFVAIPVSSVPQIHPLVAHAHHPIELAAAAVLVALLVLSIVRRGARGWLAGTAEEHHHDSHPSSRDGGATGESPA
jgi:uncharacterized membrane protein YraQ (UPF0718 family)